VPPAPGSIAGGPQWGRSAVVPAAVLSIILVLVGCVAPQQQTTLALPPTPSPTPSVTPSPVLDDTAGDEARAAFYAQQLTWADCGGGFQCTRVSAPLDWDAPDAGAIEIAVKRLPASGSGEQRIGSLLINPGGPGGSGVERLAGIVDRVIGSDIRAAYDVVSFDPRGVGQSTPVTCGDDAALTDRYFTHDADIDNQADLDQARSLVRRFGRACLAATGPLLGEVDTVSTAHDLDLLRAVLGDSQLHYLGFSYGTFLGATYADLYPRNVARMVLDGALDPAQSLDDLLIGQAVGFENALRAYVTDCQAGGSCPLTGGVDAGLAQVADLVDRIEEAPIPAGDGKQLNGMLAFYGIVVNLYSHRSWPNLTAALNEAMFTGTGTLLLADANRYLDRTPDGGYTRNANLARTAINCLDYPAVRRDYDEMVAFADRVTAVAPTFGEVFAMGAGCEAWPIEASGARHRITATGAPPILVIGTTGDPATPYEWSVALADQLASGVLLTWVGEGHTAYGRSGACVNVVVESYLLTGTPPADGTTC
jgi:pimeloyl-ACP methyl ester carboxylesterase